jgi:hypothetical protein
MTDQQYTVRATMSLEISSAGKKMADAQTRVFTKWVNARLTQARKLEIVSPFSWEFACNVIYRDTELAGYRSASSGRVSNLIFFRVLNVRSLTLRSSFTDSSGRAVLWGAWLLLCTGMLSATSQE